MRDMSSYQCFINKKKIVALKSHRLTAEGQVRPSRQSLTRQSPVPLNTGKDTLQEHPRDSLVDSQVSLSVQ